MVGPAPASSCVDVSVRVAWAGPLGRPWGGSPRGGVAGAWRPACLELSPLRAPGDPAQPSRVPHHHLMRVCGYQTPVWGGWDTVLTLSVPDPAGCPPSRGCSPLCAAPRRPPTPCAQPAPHLMHLTSTQPRAPSRLPPRARSQLPTPCARRQAGELTFPCKAEGGVCIGTPCHPRALCQPPSSPRLLSQVGAPAVGALFFLVTHRPLGLPLWAQVPWHPI